MIATFLATFVFFCLMVAAMAIGVLRGRPPISGTCGGLSNLGVDGTCEICGGQPSNCEAGNPDSRDTAAPDRGGFYNADR